MSTQEESPDMTTASSSDTPPPLVSEDNLSPSWSGDDRVSIPRNGSERDTLVAFLKWHQRTFELKCLGVDPARLSERSVPPSGLSLHGLVRHLAGTERWWFQIQYAGLDVPMINYTEEDPDQDFEWLDGDVEEALDVWRRECARSHEIIAGAESLDAPAGRMRSGRGDTFTLRWLLLHHIAEYARHNGHADLLREQIDGAVGM